MYIYNYTCMSVYSTMYVYDGVCVCVTQYVTVYVCLQLCMTVYMYVCTCTCMCMMVMCLSVGQTVYMGCISVCMFDSMHVSKFKKLMEFSQNIHVYNKLLQVYFVNNEVQISNYRNSHELQVNNRETVCFVAPNHEDGLPYPLE